MIRMPRSYYLAHPLSSRKEVREWEIEFEKRTGISLLNPFYDVDRPDVQDLDRGALNPIEKDPIKKVEDDLEGLKSQEGLFCLLDNNETIGVYQEMVYGRIFGKVVHTVATRKESRAHGWIRYHSTQIFNNLEEFEQFVRAR